MLNVSAFIGHFHPVLVHLPIGALLLAAVFQFLTWRSGHDHYAKALFITVAIGSAAAILSGITGFLLSQSAEYDEELVGWHQWLGIAVAVFSICWLLLLRKTYRLPKTRTVKASTATGALIFLLVIITGHLGGTLTHGEDYLTFNPGKEQQQKVARKPIENVQAAVAYTDIIKPILSSSCYSCHGETKQKGKLRLDLPELIMKGGKNGEIVKPSQPSESEMITRLLLPMDHKKHMPPREKLQLTGSEKALLHWWIATGASYDKKVSELAQDAKIVPVLAALSKPETNDVVQNATPEEPVAKGDPDVITSLQKRGVVILPLSTSSNYLTANFVSAPNTTDADIKLLVKLKQQLVQLKLGDTKIGDSALAFISQCSNLRQLQLQHTAISDKGLKSLLSLKKLQELNLVGTGVTSNGIVQLKALGNLERIYLYQTAVMHSGWQELQQAFPKTRLDSGGYQVPMLVTDTSFVEAKKTDPKKPEPKQKELKKTELQKSGRSGRDRK
jgi:uncharacterized membrane protein